MLRFHSLEFCFTISCFCLTLFLVFDGGQPLLLCFRSLEFCISIGFRFCLTLLFRFRSLEFCFGLGGRLGLVRARRIRLLRPWPHGTHTGTPI